MKLVFLDLLRGTTFKVNPKVMFTFFVNNKQRFKELPITEVDHVDYFITRNPYERNVSLFFYNCREGRMLKLPKPEPMQAKIMKGLKLDYFQDLNNVSFDEFCALIPEMWEQDWHTIPQAFGVDFSIVRHVVDLHSLGVMSDELGIDFSRKENTSEHGEWRSYYSKLSMFAIHTVYRKDFELLGYPKS